MDAINRTQIFIPAADKQKTARYFLQIKREVLAAKHRRGHFKHGFFSELPFNNLTRNPARLNVVIADGIASRPANIIIRAVRLRNSGDGLLNHLRHLFPYARQMSAQRASQSSRLRDHVIAALGFKRRNG